MKELTLKALYKNNFGSTTPAEGSAAAKVECPRCQAAIGTYCLSSFHQYIHWERTVLFKSLSVQ